MTKRCPKARQTQMAQGVTGHQLKPMTQLGLTEQMHPGIGKHQAQKAQGTCLCHMASSRLGQGLRYNRFWV